MNNKKNKKWVFHECVRYCQQLRRSFFVSWYVGCKLFRIILCIVRCSFTPSQNKISRYEEKYVCLKNSCMLIIFNGSYYCSMNKYIKLWRIVYLSSLLTQNKFIAVEKWNVAKNWNFMITNPHILHVTSNQKLMSFLFWQLTFRKIFKFFIDVKHTLKNSTYF